MADGGVLTCRLDHRIRPRFQASGVRRLVYTCHQGLRCPCKSSLPYSVATFSLRECASAALNFCSCPLASRLLHTLFILLLLIKVIKQSILLIVEWVKSWCFSCKWIFACRFCLAAWAFATLSVASKGENIVVDTLAEWLRRWPAKPVGFSRESSNLSGVAPFFLPSPFSDHLRVPSLLQFLYSPQT